jgi:hypothetical protein
MTRFLGWAAGGSVSVSPANGSISTEADADLAITQPFQYIVLIVNSVMRRKENIRLKVSAKGAVIMASHMVLERHITD